MGVTGGASTAIRAASLTRISSRWRKQIVLDRGGDDGGECVKEQVSHQPQGPPPVTGNGRPLAPLGNARSPSPPTRASPEGD